MKHTFLGAALLGALCLPSGARAGLIDLDLGGATNVPADGSNGLGTAFQSFTFPGTSLTVTAAGYKIGSPNTPSTLYSKHSGPEGATEHGLGLLEDFSTPGGHEIDSQHFIQFGVSNLRGNVSDLQLQVGSLGGGEEYSIHGSNTAGVLGTLVTTRGGTIAGGDADVFDIFGLLSSFDFIDITAARGDNVVNLAIANVVNPFPTSSPVPEPASLALFGLGAAALAGWRWVGRQRATAPAHGRAES
jgi:hypothetical protein